MLVGFSTIFAAAGIAAAQPPGSPNGTDIRLENGQSWPPGTTEIRPRICRPPQTPVPSILDCRPHSTLVTPSHLVPRATFPAIDFHGHPQDLTNSADGESKLGGALDSINVQLMIAADNLSGERLQRAVAAIDASPKMKDRVRVLAGIDFRNVSPGWSEKVIAQLHADLAACAVGVGEISKSLGLAIRKPEGSHLRIDDPELDRIRDECGTNVGVSEFRVSFTHPTRKNS